MDFRFSPDAEDFRSEVVAFLSERMPDAPNHPDPLDLTGLDVQFERALHLEAGERGWLDLPPERRAVFQYEVARCDAPLIDTAITLAGAFVRECGSEDQIATVYRAMREGRVEACIALTEKDAGSDLSAVATTATEIDGQWEINGTKVLVTGAHKADWCVTLAVTEPGRPYRQSMSMFLVALPAEGVTLVRRPTANGWTLDDVVFDGARIPRASLLGTRGEGWRQMGQALASEGSGFFHIGFARHALDLLIDWAKTQSMSGRPVREDPVVREGLAELAVQLADADRLARRVVWHAEQGQSVPVLNSMVKVVGSELLQRIADQAGRVAGPAALAWAPLFGGPDVSGGRLGWEYLERVHGTIGAGANEVHRDGIAAAVLAADAEEGR